MQKTTNILLAAIAVCLIFVALKLYAPQAAAAQSSETSDYQMRTLSLFNGMVVVMHDHKVMVYELYPSEVTPGSPYRHMHLASVTDVSSVK